LVFLELNKDLQKETMKTAILYAGKVKDYELHIKHLISIYGKDAKLGQIVNEQLLLKNLAPFSFYSQRIWRQERTHFPGVRRDNYG